MILEEEIDEGVFGKVFKGIFKGLFLLLFNFILKVLWIIKGNNVCIVVVKMFYGKYYFFVV